MLTLVLVVILAALIFEFINGFHDTANSIATVVATKVLSPGQAVMLAAGMNLVGALMGTAVAKTIASGLVNTDVVQVTSQVILCALLGGIVWNLITWWKGLPSSSSHALIGGLCGAALAAAHNDWAALIWSEAVGDWTKNKGILWKVVLPMITSPIAGFLLGILVMVALWGLIALLSRLGGWLGRLARPHFVNRFFGKAQILSAAYMGYAHGHNDAQKTMGIIALTLFGAEASGALDDLPGWLAFLHPGAAGEQDIAMWIVITCAIVMALGTAMGGWKIIKFINSFSVFFADPVVKSDIQSRDGRCGCIVADPWMNCINCFRKRIFPQCTTIPEISHVFKINAIIKRDCPFSPTGIFFESDPISGPCIGTSVRNSKRRF